MSRIHERVPPIYFVNHFTGSTHWTARRAQIGESIGNLNYHANSSNVQMHYPVYGIYYRNPLYNTVQFHDSHLSTHRRLQSRLIRRRNRLEENASILNRRFHEPFQVTIPIRNPEHSPRVSRDLPRINDLGALPNGLEMRHTSDGREYYVDQNNVPLLTSSTVVQNMLNATRRYGLEENSSRSSGVPPVPPASITTAGVADLGTLPNGWEMRHTSDGRVYYVDQNNQPRLSSSLDVQNMLNSGRSSGFGENSSISGSNETPVNITAPSDINSNTLSGIANPVPPPLSTNPSSHLPYSRQGQDLVQKLAALRRELRALQHQSYICRLELLREDIFENSYDLIMKMAPEDLRSGLAVKFKSEEGIDYGGVAREWIELLSHEMLNPHYGLFQYAGDDIYTLQINPDSSVNPAHLSYFHFVGRVIGLAVVHGYNINGGFTVPFYKMLLNKPITLEDIEAVDPELQRSLKWILDNDITSVIDTTFSVEHHSFGQIQVYELKPNGEEIPVMEENKEEYVSLYVNYRFRKGIEEQFRALQEGFNSLIPQHLLESFNEKELELLIEGHTKIDVENWKMYSTFINCNPDSNIVKWFWEVVHSYSEEQRARLLQFATGSSRVPLQGFKALQGSSSDDGPMLFTIHLVYEDLENLPRAHTCFNTIYIPPYKTYEKLYEKLTQAIEETCGFAIA